MFGDKRQTSLGSFLLGGLLGGVAGVLAAGRLRGRSPDGQEDGSGSDIGPFEDAPCHREWEARDAQETGAP
jgi:hypothetical protein